MKTKIISLGAILGFFSVLFGAFGTHALKGKVSDDLLVIYQTASHYLTIHALALLAYGIWYQTLAKETVKCWPASAFLFGIAIFSGSLYCITFTGIRGFGAITPLGGLLMMSGWIGFSIQSYRHTKS